MTEHAGAKQAKKEQYGQAARRHSCGPALPCNQKEAETICHTFAWQQDALDFAERCNAHLANLAAQVCLYLLPNPASAWVPCSAEAGYLTSSLTRLALFHMHDVDAFALASKHVMTAVHFTCGMYNPDSCHRAALRLSTVHWNIALPKISNAFKNILASWYTGKKVSCGCLHSLIGHIRLLK